MEVDTLIRKLECDGAVFELTGGRLKLRAKPGRAPAPEELAQLKLRRAEVITILSVRAQSAEVSPLKPASAAPLFKPPADSESHTHQLREVMRRICKQTCHEGLITWLQHSQFDLYTELTCILPKEIDHLCERQAAPEAFQATLERFFDTYIRARDLYEERLAIQEEGCGSGLSRGATFSGEGASR
jgi:hypothetical protein